MATTNNNLHIPDDLLAHAEKLAASQGRTANDLAADALKHGTLPSHEVIAGVRKQVITAPWLKVKDEKRVSDLPLHLAVKPTDRIGRLYNMLRKELDDFFNDVRPLADFRGLIVNGRFDREMYAEAGQIAKIYGVNIALTIEKRERYRQAVAQAEAAVNACALDDLVARRKAFKARNKAKAAPSVITQNRPYVIT